MKLKRSLYVRGGWCGKLLTVLMACSPLALGQSEFVVFSFLNSTAPGSAPEGNLVADAAGNLYGTSFAGGPLNAGNVFELVRPVPPHKQWSQKVLYMFTGGLDGGNPVSGVIIDAAGNLYGTINTGGTTANGVVFRLAPPTTVGGEWTETAIYSFQGGSIDGEHPMGGLVFDKAGNLYGTLSQGGFTGNPNCRPGCGTVFQLTPPATVGGAWNETTIHYFNYSNGDFPVSAPIIDAQGNLYGTTQGGGTSGTGVVYRLTPPTTPGGAWGQRVLYAFGLSNTDSAYPMGSLTLHGAGVLYGTASYGGTNRDGTVFQLVPPSVTGGAWTENILLTFSGGDGSNPAASVVFDKPGNLYGTAQRGGKAGCNNLGCGTVFRLSPPASPGASWTETVLHAFPTSQIDGLTPSGGLMLWKNGVLFGATQNSVNSNDGAVFGIVP